MGSSSALVQKRITEDDIQVKNVKQEIEKRNKRKE
jgi:hypothetical protein